jgi:uncharacterized protein
MASYKTPDVYVEEISTLPPSVAEVSTAIPIFIGYTEKDGKDHKLKNVPMRINTLLDYKSYYGDPESAVFQVNVDGDAVTNVSITTAPKNILAHSVDLFFRNGGGSCYIMSLGVYADRSAPGANVYQSFHSAIDLVAKEDEPTLFVLSDALSLGEEYFDLVETALKQCEKLKDRFVLVDVEKGMSPSAFRSALNDGSYLKFGAAYTPHLETLLTHSYKENEVAIQGLSGAVTYNSELILREGSGAVAKDLFKVAYSGSSAGQASIVVNEAPEAASGPMTFVVAGFVLTINGVTAAGKSAADVLTAWNTLTSGSAGKLNGFQLSAIPTANATGVLKAAASKNLSAPTATGLSSNMSSIAASKTALYNQIKTVLGQQRVTLPPSAAIAGIYAFVDRDRGVWKAPANVGISAIVAPTEKISSADQEDLNIDPVSGKSINAIRSFAGKGTLVWGARTLAGNDNEWRYISVRRLFNLIEESTRKATSFAVFEANDASTWLKVKAMIDSYLYGLWERGALVGGAPDKAYFVNIGLGKTMTAQDILNGYMNVEIGIAAVRPAEFIVLKFSHKLQEA